jgi:PQQ-dependent dehydrogenase (methanol/ethanol family)
MLSTGRTIFAESCAGCHGERAQGTDRAPRLAGNRRTRARTVEEIRGIIQHGVASGGMPAFAFGPEKLDAIAVYVRSLNSAAADIAVPGDHAAGERIFFRDGNCASCHTMMGTGAVSGPDLSKVGSELTLEEIREALLEPDKKIATGYGVATVTTKSGKTIRGFVRAQSNFAIVLQGFDGRFYSVEANDIASIQDEKKSAMPATQLGEAEMQDLLAYLAKLTGVKPGARTSLESPTPKHVGPSFTDIRDPAPGEWLTYHGSLSANRFSRLDQINAQNVGGLAVKWTFPIPHFGVESTPLVSDGVMYATGPNQAYAIDAATGQMIWSYSRPRTSGLVGDASLGTNRGPAILGDKLFMVTDNAHLLALNRITGALMWEVVMPEEPQHYGSTVAPLIVNDTVIAGVSGGDWGIRGFVASYRAETGELIWRHWTIPAKGEAGSESWKGPEPTFGGGSSWLTGSYDPETDTLYWPTGNPWPDSDDRNRPGDNLFTDSILALSAQTGKLRWYYQFTPHDVRDRDANEPPVLVDTTYQGKARQLLLHADRNGFFYVLDRTNGKILLAKRFLNRVDWATGIGSDGRPQISPERNGGGPKGCPNDAANWGATAFDASTRLYYLLTLEECGAEERADSGLKTGKPVGEAGQKILRAIDIDTGDVRWEIPQTGAVVAKTWPGVLATGGGLVLFSDPNGAFIAADSRTGHVLWHFTTNTLMKASPITYLVKGKQFVAVAANSMIVSFALP